MKLEEAIKTLEEALPSMDDGYIASGKMEQLWEATGTAIDELKKRDNFRDDYLDFVNLVTFHYFKKMKFDGAPSFHVAKAAFLGCLPEWRREQIWIPVSDRLPPEHDTIFAKLKGTEQWKPGMFEKQSEDVRVVFRFEDGTRKVGHNHTIDGFGSARNPTNTPSGR